MSYQSYKTELDVYVLTNQWKNAEEQNIPPFKRKRIFPEWQTAIL